MSTSNQHHHSCARGSISPVVEVFVSPGRCVTWRCDEPAPDSPECPTHAAEPLGPFRNVAAIKLGYCGRLTGRALLPCILPPNHKNNHCINAVQREAYLKRDHERWREKHPIVQRHGRRTGPPGGLPV